MNTKIVEPGPSLLRHSLAKYGLPFVSISVIFLALVTHQIYVSRLSAQANAATNVKNLSLVLESKLYTDFAAADRMVSAMVTEISPDALLPENVTRYRPQISRWLKTSIGDISSASALRYFNAKGDRLYTSIDGESPVNIADRPHFQQLKRNPASATIFSEVTLGRATGRISMYVAKAILDKEGSFLGIASVAIDLTTLQEWFRGIELGSEGVIALRRVSNGALLVRSPALVELDDKPAPDIPIRQAILKDSPVGTIEISSPIDGIHRIFGDRMIGTFPFFVVVGVADNAYLAEWRKNSMELVFGSFIFFVILAADFYRLAVVELRERRSEIKLLESERSLKIAADAGEIGIWDLDLVTGKVSHSLHHDRIFGFTSTEEQWNAAKFLSHVIPADHDFVARQMQESAAGGKLHFECRIMRSDQVVRWISAKGETFTDEQGNPVRMLGTVQDITDRKAAEEEIRALNTELEQRVVERTAKLDATVRDLKTEISERGRAEQALRAANQEMEAFAHSVSHDLRAPLRSIAGFSKVLEEDYDAKLDEDGKDALHRVRSAAQRMGELIDDLLLLSRLTRSDMKMETVDLSALARSTVDKLEESEPGRCVTFEMPPKIEVQGDRRLLAVLFENLLGNAWKFTGKHSSARIEIGVTEKDGKPAYFVRDDGAGFDMAHVANLFVPFQRLHLASDFPGTGIGLATVQRVVQRHGGRIWAEGAIDKGATFYFTLSG